jgi:hypothetical protein
VVTSRAVAGRPIKPAAMVGSWESRRLADSTIATNASLPERAKLFAHSERAHVVRLLCLCHLSVITELVRAEFNELGPS